MQKENIPSRSNTDTLRTNDAFGFGVQSFVEFFPNNNAKAEPICTILRCRPVNSRANERVCESEIYQASSFAAAYKSIRVAMHRRRSSLSSCSSESLHIGLFLTCLHPFLQVVLKGLLGSLGYKVERALSGDEALQLMLSRDHLPDLIFLDVNMPKESGYEV